MVRQKIRKGVEPNNELLSATAFIRFVPGRTDMPCSSQRSFPGLCALLACLAGCGGDNPAPGEAPSSAGPAASSTPAGIPELDPCALVSQAEIEKIIGSAVDQPEPSANSVAGVTFYSCRSDDVHVNVEAWSNAEDAKTSFEMGTEYPAIDDMGHPARNTQPLGDLDVLVGQYVLTIDLFTSTDRAAELAAAKEIARLAIPRLP